MFGVSERGDHPGQHHHLRKPFQWPDDGPKRVSGFQRYRPAECRTVYQRGAAVRRQHQGLHLFWHFGLFDCGEDTNLQPGISGKNVVEQIMEGYPICSTMRSWCRKGLELRAYVSSVWCCGYSRQLQSSSFPWVLTVCLISMSSICVCGLLIY